MAISYSIILAIHTHRNTFCSGQYIHHGHGCKMVIQRVVSNLCNSMLILLRIYSIFLSSTFSVMGFNLIWNTRPVLCSLVSVINFSPVLKSVKFSYKYSLSSVKFSLWNILPEYSPVASRCMYSQPRDSARVMD